VVDDLSVFKVGLVRYVFTVLLVLLKQIYITTTVI
jgi:hypothetical protein